MRIKLERLVVVGGLAMASLLQIRGSAADAGAQQQGRARLEQRAARIDTDLGRKTGGMQRADLIRQRKEIDAAIQKIQSGRSVSTEEIDRILGETSIERAR